MRTERRRAEHGILIGVAAALFLLAACDGGADAPTQDEQAATAPAAEANAEEIATDFLGAAYGAFDAKGAMAYVADDADLDLTGLGVADTAGLRLLLAFWEATGYEQILDPCEVTGSSADGTAVRCTFDFHAIRSDEIGLGPYSGNHFDLTVHDGKVVEASQSFEIAEFSPQMWEPFAAWVSETHPKDFAVMYTGGGTDFRLTEESIRLWRQRTHEYVKEVAAS